MKGTKRFIGGPRADAYHCHKYLHKYLVRLLLLLGLTTIFLDGILANAMLQGYELTYRDKPFDILFIDDKHGWVVGNEGLILRTEDGGVSWLKLERKTIDPLFGIDFVNSRIGWIVGKRGLILHTKTGGEHWENQKSGTDNDLMAIKFLDAKKGFAIGSYGTIVRTNDGGQSWQVYPIDWENELKEVMESTGITSPHLYDISFAGECGCIVGENGVILWTNDGGANWCLRRGGILPPIFSVYLRGCSKGLAVGQNGLALITDDGETWKKIGVPATENLLKIRIREDFGLIVGDYGTILISYDGGKTWERFSQTDEIASVWLIDVCPVSSFDRKAVIIGKGLLKIIEFKQRE